MKMQFFVVSFLALSASAYAQTIECTGYMKVTDVDGSPVVGQITLKSEIITGESDEQTLVMHNSDSGEIMRGTISKGTGAIPAFELVTKDGQSGIRGTLATEVRSFNRGKTVNSILQGKSFDELKRGHDQQDVIAILACKKVI